MGQLLVVGGSTPASATTLTLAAKRRGWKTETMIRRVEAALPSQVERQLYLKIARTISANPETVAKILRVLVGDQQLSESDMHDVTVGPNLKINRFVATAELVLETLTVTHVLAEHYGSVSATHAALLVRAYGPQFVEDVVDSLFQYLDRECGEAGERMRGIAVRWFCREGLAWCDANGCPYPNDVEDWLDLHGEPRISLHRYVRHVKSYTRNR